MTKEDVGQLRAALEHDGQDIVRGRAAVANPEPEAARELDAVVMLRNARRRRQRASLGKISAKCCSFSAVSAPIFARKYAFCNIFQNLPDSQTEIFEI